MSMTSSAISKLPLGASLEVFTDGSCIVNPGPCGWAVVIVHDGRVILKHSAGLPHGTNNVAELMAAIDAVEGLKDRPDLTATILSDSQYVVLGMTSYLANWKRNGWKTSDKKPVKNQHLWERLDAARETLPLIRFRKVKGHAGVQFNEMADALANEAAERSREVA